MNGSVCVAGMPDIAAKSRSAGSPLWNREYASQEQKVKLAARMEPQTNVDKRRSWDPCSALFKGSKILGCCGGEISLARADGHAFAVRRHHDLVELAVARRGGTKHQCVLAAQ